MTVDPILAEASRRSVLTAWGEQKHPMVLAPTLQLGKWWMVRNDEFLTKGQGSYAKFIVSPPNAHRLRGWYGVLVVCRADRMKPVPGWHDALDMVSHVPGISIWTEILP